MYDTRSIECGEKDQQRSDNSVIANHFCINNNNKNNNNTTLSSLSLSTSSSISSSSCINSESMSILIRRRRLFQRQACIISVMAAFIFGLIVGVFLPLFSGNGGFGLLTKSTNAAAIVNSTKLLTLLPPTVVLNDQTYDPILPSSLSSSASASTGGNNNLNSGNIPQVHFPTIYDIQNTDQGQNHKNSYAVSFVPDTNTNSDTTTLNHSDENNFVPIDSEKLPAETVFRNAFYLEEHKGTNTMTVKKLDANDGTIKEFTVQRTPDGLFRKSPEIRLSKPTAVEQILSSSSSSSLSSSLLSSGGGGGGGGIGVIGTGDSSVSASNIMPTSIEFVQKDMNYRNNQNNNGDIIEHDIFWGKIVEKSLPQGFKKQESTNWNEYIQKNGVITKLEIGCGRMQNRMVIFQDGTRACARYRQNTDQIQGELFSFYLGQLLNLTNLAPSAASIIDMNSPTWQLAAPDISTAQWKSLKPVVLTKWLPDLEPAGIPQPFQPLERHLNKFDIKNLTISLNNNSEQQQQQQQQEIININDGISIKKPVLMKLIELAQWSDLIIFDYLIANLDRVVNNLYNYQWNADIMAAPAHNLAKQKDSQLLVFLDNESGLLHGYRLLKKYEAYHGLLLDNLCVFRRPTIDALQRLRNQGVGQKLQRIFETTTSSTVRDVLPTLPEKSIKILIDRIDRVLGQVQKCRELFSSR